MYVTAIVSNKTVLLNIWKLNFTVSLQKRNYIYRVEYRYRWRSMEVLLCYVAYQISMTNRLILRQVCITKWFSVHVCIREQLCGRQKWGGVIFLVDHTLQWQWKIHGYLEILNVIAGTLYSLEYTVICRTSSNNLSSRPLEFLMVYSCNISRAR